MLMHGAAGICISPIPRETLVTREGEGGPTDSLSGSQLLDYAIENPLLILWIIFF